MNPANLCESHPYVVILIPNNKKSMKRKMCENILPMLFLLYLIDPKDILRKVE